MLLFKKISFVLNELYKTIVSYVGLYFTTHWVLPAATKGYFGWCKHTNQ